jgi:hypothetical protein
MRRESFEGAETDKQADGSFVCRIERLNEENASLKMRVAMDGAQKSRKG